MPFFKTQDIKIWTNGTWLNLAKDFNLKSFSTDTRSLNKGDTFVCINAQRDGHDFAKDAESAGANAIITQRELEGITIPQLVVADTLLALQNIAKFHRLRFEFPVLAVTGSCGKSTTKESLAKILSWKNPSYTEKNYNNEIGVALSILKSDLKFNKLAIIEAGVAAQGQMSELATMIEPDLVVVTNIAPAHLDGFVDIASVAKEKALLAENCAIGGFCVMHSNLLSWKAFDELKCKKAVAIPMDAPDVKADLAFRYKINYNESDINIELCLEGGNEYYFEMPITSKGNAENMVLVIIASLMLGAKEELILSGLQRLQNLGMRNLFIEKDDVKLFVDCYNANPASMKDSLDFFEVKSAQATNRHFLIGPMADLGIASIRLHKDIASYIKRKEGDKVVIIGDTQDLYKSSLLEAGWAEEDISIFNTSEEAQGYLSEAKGHIFLKASRKYELEKAIPQEFFMSQEELEKLAKEKAQEEVEEPQEEYKEEKPKKKNKKGKKAKIEEDEGEEFPEDFDDEDFIERIDVDREEHSRFE
ncbi:MAG: Mur ligase family protein [Opitutales bacterium]